jgi:LCP family protein required for cell wall assembly
VAGGAEKTALYTHPDPGPDGRDSRTGVPLDIPPPKTDDTPSDGRGTLSGGRQVTIYKAERRRRRISLKKAILIGLGVILLLVLALAGAVAWWANGVYGQISNVTPGVRQAQQELDTTPPLPDQPAVALVIGSDHRGTDPKGNPGLSDTLMLVRIDPRTRYISLLSIPRDLQVDIPGVGTDKINAAYTFGGPKLALETVKGVTGVKVNYLITVDFLGFRDLVNAFGGVYVNVDQYYFHSNATSVEHYSEIDVKPGYQLLKGSDALAFARFRHTDSDFYRNARQQLFLQAFESRVSGRLHGISLTDIPTIKDIVETIAHNVQVTGAHGAPSIRTIINYARLAYAIKGRVLSARLDAAVAGDASYSYVTVSDSSMAHAVYQFTHPQKVGHPTAELPKGKKRHKRRHHGFRPAVDPSTVTVSSLNGNGVAGSAGAMAQALEPFGYQIVGQQNADSFTYTQTQVLYRPGYAKAAADLVRILGIGRDAPMPATYTQAGDVVVVAGSDFTGKTAIKAPPTPAAAPPSATVHSDDQIYLPYFQQAARAVHFRALYPTVVQNSSLFEPYTSSEPVRAYRIAAAGKGRNSLYAVFKLGDLDGAYWGIEQTRFTDAPILDNPDVTRRLDGRDYRFYFNGQHIHLIAFQQHGVAVWVTNTLRDDLRNQDMVAIARSLRPVS